MNDRTVAGAVMAIALLMPMPRGLRAQDIPGMEICTVERTMERRTSCLQSDVEFLQKTITRLAADHRQRLDAASRQIETLKVTIANLQKVVADLQAAQRQRIDDLKKTGAPAGTERTPAPPKDGGK
jgi:hypothetical protein